MIPLSRWLWKTWSVVIMWTKHFIPSFNRDAIKHPCERLPGTLGLVPITPFLLQGHCGTSLCPQQNCTFGTPYRWEIYLYQYVFYYICLEKVDTCIYCLVILIERCCNLICDIATGEYSSKPQSNNTARGAFTSNFSLIQP